MTTFGEAFSSALGEAPLADVLQMLRDSVPALTMGDPVFRVHYLRAIDEFDSGKNPYELPLFLQLRRYPADMEEFMFGKSLLERPRREIYPAVLDELCKINNPNGYRLTNPYTEAVFTGGIGCLPAETEFLSPRGWVRMDSWDGEVVASYLPESGKVSFVSPEYISFPCDSFIRFRTQYGLDMVLSDEHRVLYRTSKGNLGVHTAGEVLSLHTNSVKGFNGKILTSFSVDRPGVPFSDEQLRVMVAVQADGHFPKHLSGCHVIVRVKKERKIVRMRSLLTDAGILFKETVSEGYSRFAFKAPIRSKDFSWAWDCSSAQLSVISDEALLWDGNQKNTYYTTDKSCADFMSYCFSASGWRAVVDRDTRGLCECLFSVRRNPNVEVSMQGVPKTPMVRVPSSDGKKYCFSVPSGFFVARHNGRVFITGNSAKSTSAIYTNAYQLYVLSCFDNPHAAFSLDSTSEILFVFQSLTGDHAETGDYARFRALCEQSAYFRTLFPFDMRNKKTLKFPSRIEVRPIGSDTGAIGSNVMGGMIEEMNFMKIVEKSKKTIDQGTYNQALTVYNGLARRRKSRFVDAGTMPGILCLVSSKRYPGEFTDKKIEEAKTDPSIYIYDKRVWEVKPEGTFSSGWFSVFSGDLTRKAHIMKPNEVVPLVDKDLVVSVPNDFLQDFKDDLIGALRDIAGVGTLARYPFMQNVEKVSAGFGRVPSVFGTQETDFVEKKLEIILKNIVDPHLPRWCHIDLAVTGDSCGFTLGHVPGFKHTVRESSGGKEEEAMPIVRVDGMLRILPPRDQEILFYKVRDILYLLRDRGMNIKWVSFDQFQSVDSQQILRQKGFVTGRQSVDTDNTPYDLTKSAFYEDRLLVPEHGWCLTELLSLEKDQKTGKIDHPKQGSKDVADSLAGVVYGLTMRREIWGMFNIPIITLINRTGAAATAPDKMKEGVKDGSEN